MAMEVFITFFVVTVIVTAAFRLSRAEKDLILPQFHDKYYFLYHFLPILDKSGIWLKYSTPPRFVSQFGIQSFSLL